MRHSLLLLILGLAFSTIIACGTPTPLGEPAEHARINAMTDCAELREEFFEPAVIVELTAIVAFENFRSKFNHALQVEANGICTVELTP